MRSALAMSFVALAACDMAPSGYSAPYKPMNPDPVPVNIASDAPSISQQFRAPKHFGVDIYHPKGSPILAADTGVVTELWTDPMYGLQIVLTHGADVSGQLYQTVYKHLSGVSVEKGDSVARGQRIGALGNSGALSAGLPHLHFEVWIGGGEGAVDPNLMWEGGEGVARCFDPQTDSGQGVIYPVGCGTAAS